VTLAFVKVHVQSFILSDFRQPIELPLKFLNPVLTGKDFEILWTSFDLGLRDWTSNLLKYSELDLV